MFVLSQCPMEPSTQKAASSAQEQQAVEQAWNNTANSTATANLNLNQSNGPAAQTSASALAETNAAADKIQKLQLEQQRHNQVIRMAQADRNERAMQANQEATVKRRRQEAKKDGLAAPPDSTVPPQPLQAVLIPPSEVGVKGASGDYQELNAPHVVADLTQDVSASSTQRVSPMNDAAKSIIAHQFPNANEAFTSTPQHVSMNDAVTTTNTQITNVNEVSASSNQQAPKNDVVKSMIAQFPNANAATLTSAAAGMGFPKAGLLTNPNFAAQLGVATKLPPGLMMNPTLDQNQGLQVRLAQGLQTGLGQGLQTGLPGKPSLGAAAHQKLGAGNLGAAILPCRARGMPVDHNFKTAYFVIPQGIEHGDELVCSYPACRQAGVKFRYCLHCEVPVAKRNFRNRHRHCAPEDLESEESEESEEEQDAVTCQPCPDSAGVKRSASEGSDEGAGVQREFLVIVPGADDPRKKRRKRKKGYVRIPCRARGMPMAHNSKTAYFDIPPTIQHGDEVLCSFPSCRSAGVKFRYCLHCKVPVAKRNFRNRHRHGDLCDRVEGKELGGPEEGEEERGKTLASPAEEDGKPPAQADAWQPTKREEDAAPPPQSVAPLGTAARPSVGKKVSVNSTRGATEVQRWVDLLANKPPEEDKKAMAVWMMNLMNAPDSGDGAAAPALAPTGNAARIGDAALGEDDAQLAASGSNQPPKKKFKKDFGRL